MMLKLANTEMHMWDKSNCARINADGRDRKNIYFFYFGDYNYICHFYSKSFQEHLLFMMYYSY